MLFLYQLVILFLDNPEFLNLHSVNPPSLNIILTKHVQLGHNNILFCKSPSAAGFMETAIGRYHSGIFLETVLDVAHESEADRMKITKQFCSGFKEVLQRHCFFFTFGENVETA